MLFISHPLVDHIVISQTLTAYIYFTTVTYATIMSHDIVKLTDSHDNVTAVATITTVIPFALQLMSLSKPSTDNIKDRFQSNLKRWGRSITTIDQNVGVAAI